MTTPHHILFCAAALFGAAVLASCDKSPKSAEASQPSAPAELKIAYVEVDSLMTQYRFSIESKKELEAKGENIQKSLGQKEAALRAAAANFQQKVQANAYTREQAEAIQANLQKQSADLQALQQRLQAEFQEETNAFNNALRDSLQHFIAKYNKKKHYTLILAKSGDNILYADKGIDITDQVVKGLNKAYRPKKKK